MKMTARSARICLPLLMILGLAGPAAAQTNSLKQQLLGHWQLVSVTVNGTTPYGANPQGSMFLDAGGHISVVVVSAGNARSLSYFGTYTVDEASKLMTMHVVASSGGSRDQGGRDFKRLLTLSGDELTVTNETPSGGPGPITLTWKRAN
jgi:hypothetical protein